MNDNYKKDDTFLGRWVAGDLSDKELVEFKKTEAYKQFKVINQESQQLLSPEIDVESALIHVKRNFEVRNQKAKTIKLWSLIGTAAMLIISLGLFFNSTKTYNNDIGETQTIVLEDGSSINLNANSSVSHKRFFWSKNKTVKLKGEAYFNITTGADFSVNTSKGTIHVLGTKFNVRDRSNFELKCYEGKIEFFGNEKKASSKILTKGMQVTIEDSTVTEKLFDDPLPSWKNGISKFDNQSLSLVLEELTQYYKIEFDTKHIRSNRLYTGSFSHNNLDLALKATLAAMGIEYRLEKDVYILSE